jgi:hypothetical protein
MDDQALAVSNRPPRRARSTNVLAALLGLFGAIFFLHPSAESRLNSFGGSSMLSAPHLPN